jgi:hypothetical protein
MEFWDGTKSESIPHVEAMNDHLEAQGKAPTQDTSRFFWKSEQELHWELMGSCGEKNIFRNLKFLVNDLKYLDCRNNPEKRFDRTKQYAFQDRLVQEHLNKLSAIMKVFLDAGRKLHPIQYAIEALTREGVSIEELSVEKVAAKFVELHTLYQQDEEARKYEKGKKLMRATLPGFIRLALKKDETSGFSAASPLRKFAQWIAQNDPIDSSKTTESIPAKRPHRLCQMRESIPQIRGIDSSKTTESIPSFGGVQYHSKLAENTNKDIQTEITNTVVEEVGKSSRTHQTTTATVSLSYENLSEEEIALILTYRQQRDHMVISSSSNNQCGNTNHIDTPPSESMPPVPDVPTSKQAAIVTQINKQRATSDLSPTEEVSVAVAPSVPDLERPTANTPLTAEVIVQLLEYKHGVRYDDETRPYQLQAARALLGLRLALSVEVLEKVYDECCDNWWKSRYGDLHVSHLVEKERKHGQRRIIRLLKRVQGQEQSDTAPVSTHKKETIYREPGTYILDTGEYLRIVEWKGRLVPEEEAYREGYQGGFERFKKGDHPDDDLEATLKRLQAEGKIPIL